NDPNQRQEMIEKSGQMLSPCVEIDGRMLPDISGEEVEAYLLANNLVGPTARQADAPTNQPCAHETAPGAPMFFQRLLPKLALQCPLGFPTLRVSESHASKNKADSRVAGGGDSTRAAEQVGYLRRGRGGWG